MLWHAVRFDFTGIAADIRTSVEADLAALVDLDVVERLHLGRDVDDPDVTGLLVVLADEAALATYRDHPDHLPVVQRIRELGLGVTRFDIVVDEPADHE